ncbi:cornifin-B [Capsella rubella]|uniref:cornifin-B n=1 Tax=Capsella rubella TaxID=81985 RepID=UPI000CD53362|nr:cornifin-B [Capsella rubella]
MSVTLIHSYLVRDYFAVPFLTPQGIGYHHFCRNSFLHVPQRVVPLLGLKKRSQKPYFKPSTTTTEKPQSNPNPVHDEKPVHQAKAPPPTHQEAPPTTHQEAPPTTHQEAPPTTHQEAPPPTHQEASPPTRQEAPRTHQEAPPPTHQEAPPPTRQEVEFFGGSVTMGAAPSPRHVPIPMFCVREKIKESSKLIKT